MTTRGRSRLAARFAIALDLVEDQIPKLGGRCQELGNGLSALEARVLELEERTLRRRAARVWQRITNRRSNDGDQD